MQDLLKNFGVDPILLSAQIVNFLIIFWLLKKFAYKPIFQILEKRKKLIAEGIENARKSEELLQKSLDEEKALLKKAQAEAQEILADAQKQSTETIERAEEKAKERVEKMLEDGKKEIDQQTQEAEKQLSKHTAKLAVEIVEKTLPAIADTKTQKAVIGKLSKKLKA